MKYAPRAHLRKGALRPHYGDDDDYYDYDYCCCCCYYYYYIGKEVLDEGADRGESTRGK